MFELVGCRPQFRQSVASLVCLAVLLVFGTSARAQDGTAYLDDVKVTLTSGVDTNHRPRPPTRQVPESTRVVHLAFESQRPQGRQLHRVEFDLYAVASNQKINSNSGWVEFSHGSRYSAPLDIGQLRLGPGHYRVVLRSGTLNATIPMELAAKHPLALTVSAVREHTETADSGLSRTDWTLTSAEGTEFDLSGPNLALRALGGRIAHVSSEFDWHWGANWLIDGIAPTSLPPPDERKCATCGWATNDQDSDPQVVLSFHQGRTAPIVAVVFDTTVHDWTNRGEHIDALPKYIEIATSTTSPTSGFSVATRATLRREEGIQIVPMPAHLEAKYVRVRVLETYRSEKGAVLGEIMVIERADVERSILHDADIDIAAFGLGGALVRFTQFQWPNPAPALFDHLDDSWWRSVDDYFPQSFTVSFSGNQQALVDQVRLTLSAKASRESYPTEVAIAVSEHNPLRGFEEVGRFSVKSTTASQSFPVDRMARYVRVQFLGNNGGDHTSVGDLAVIEGRQPGYTSILYRRGPGAVETRLRDLRAGPSTSTAFDDASPETEENNTVETADELVPGSTVTGVIASPGDADVYRVSGLNPAGSTLTLEYRGLPSLRAQFELSSASGRVLGKFDPGDVLSDRALLSYRIIGEEEAFIRISEPLASVVVVWDKSGSMRGNDSNLENAVREYIRRAPAEQEIALVSFSDEVEVLTRDFTSDKPYLLSLVDASPDGSTRLYDAVIKALELLDGRQGNRAIVVMTDGADNGPTWHDTFWREVEGRNIRLYTIGLGNSMWDYSLKYATTGERVLHHLALATDGESFFSSDSTDLASFYGRIADELAEPGRYALRPTVESGEGTLRVTATQERVPGSARPSLHVILDVSGSMNERRADGRRRWDVAVNALFAALEGLDQSTTFGLTVYGARVPEKPNKAKACKDILTVQEAGPLDHGALRNFVKKQLKPRGGTTPMVDALRHVVQDFKGRNGGIIVLLTDGIEECEKDDPKGAVARLAAQRMGDIELNVIGFDVDEHEATDLMKSIADIGGGQFYDVTNPDALRQALQVAMAARYIVRDGSGEVVAQGSVGGPAISLPTGYVNVEIKTADFPAVQREVRIDEAHEALVEVRKAGLEFDVNVGAPVSLEEQRAARHTCGQNAQTRSEAERVGRIQAGLDRLGYDTGGVDGRWGGNTGRALEAFARAHALAFEIQPSLVAEQHLDCVIATGSPHLPATEPKPVTTQ